MQLRDSPSGAHIDGVWWPQSRDLHVEAADLVDHFPDEVGRIDLLLFSRPDWDNSVVDGRGVRRIRARRGQVTVGSFPSDDTQLMIVLLAGGRRVSLRVIASSTDPGEAHRLFRAVGNSRTSDDSVEATRVQPYAARPEAPWL